MNSIWSYENLGLVFIALLIAIGGMYSYKLLSFLMPLLTIVVIWAQGGPKNISFYVSPPMVFLGLLLIWAGMSVFWAINPIPALKVFIELSVTFVFAFLLISSLIKATPDLISKAYRIMQVSGFFLILFVLFHALADAFYMGFFTGDPGRPYMIKPTGSLLGLTAFVGCAFLWTQKNKSVFGFMAFILLILMAYLTRCQTAKYGIILASFMFILSYAMPFWTTRISMVASYTFLVLSPLIYVYVLPTSLIMELPYLKRFFNLSLLHRYMGWEVFSKSFFEKPFLGWGIESTRYLPPDPILINGYGKLIHPHNNSVQAYLELGVVGGVLYALFFASLFWVVEKHVKDRLSVAVCNATIVFGFVTAEITHNIWRNYWLSVVALTVGLVILFLKAREEQLRVEADHLKRSPIH